CSPLGELTFSQCGAIVGTRIPCRKLSAMGDGGKAGVARWRRSGGNGRTAIESVVGPLRAFRFGRKACFAPALLLQAVDDLFHFLRSRARQYEHGVRRLDDDDVLEADGGHEPARRSDVAVPAFERENVAEKRIT